jgi:hypothetical protein
METFWQQLWQQISAPLVAVAAAVVMLLAGAAYKLLKRAVEKYTGSLDLAAERQLVADMVRTAEQTMRDKTGSEKFYEVTRALAARGVEVDPNVVEAIVHEVKGVQPVVNVPSAWTSSDRTSYEVTTSSNMPEGSTFPHVDETGQVSE